MLSHVHGISRLHAAALGDALVDRHLAVEEGGAYRCIHPVIAHMVRDGLTASRRQETHRSLALALELALGPDEAADSAGEIARHADRGGERALAYRYALLAARGGHGPLRLRRGPVLARPGGLVRPGRRSSRRRSTA